MSKNSNRSNNGNNSGGFPVFAGIMLGMVIGLAIAGGIAWFVLKKNPVPTPPSKEPVVAAQAAAAAEKTAANKQLASQKAPTTSTGENKARFEFYKELTGKPDTNTGKKSEQQTVALSKPATKPAEGTAVYFLQEGAYTNADDAEKVKARLALLGMVASVQPANIPDKGVWYRVRLGPYKNSADMNEVLATMKLNGLNASPIRTQ